MSFPTIPSEESRGLVRLAQLAREQSEQLISQFRSAPVLLDRQEFLKGVAEIKGVPREDLEQIVWSLMYLHSYLVFGDIDVREFVGDVCSSLGNSGVEQQIVDSLQKVLPQFLEVDSLRLRAKAIDLQVDHPRVFQSARIITDVRPVFALNSASDVYCILISHILKLVYYQEEGTREIFLAIDDRDISDLRKTLDRAEDKARALRSRLGEDLKWRDIASMHSEY